MLTATGLQSWPLPKIPKRSRKPSEKSTPRRARASNHSDRKSGSPLQCLRR
ncbi:hypothetical protein XH83_07670 [Bradyrhizobium sp. CCBAU 53351]|nr:hypothetical protein XH83_07670 [Bradyrhizobium sp. CCBAU 53351]